MKFETCETCAGNIVSPKRINIVLLLCRWYGHKCGYKWAAKRKETETVYTESVREKGVMVAIALCRFILGNENKKGL